MTDEAPDPITFDDFDLDNRCIRVLHTQHITIPTPVQREAIPIALEGRDLIALAQTGTGKTLGFSLPALTRLAKNKPVLGMMLVLVPTRELAVQVGDVVKTLGKALHIRVALVYGGVGYGPQIDAIEKGASIVVATPGRLLDHLSRRTLHFRNLEILVLDEADRMLDMGFYPDISRIVSKLPKDRQTMLFSATFPDSIARLGNEMLTDPTRVSVGAVAKPVDKVTQYLYAVHQEDKSRLLVNLLEAEPFESVLVFLRTKQRTDRLNHTLRKSGLKAAVIHGDLSQRLRQQALDGFKSGRYNVLVATDVAARGLDVDGISHVVNFDIPQAAEDYIHRIGRTARAEAEGTAITFVCPNEYAALSAIERGLGKSIERVPWEKAPPLLQTATAQEAKKAQTRRGARRPARRTGRMLRRR